MEDLEKRGWIYWEKKDERWIPYEKVYSEDGNLTKIKKLKCRSIFYDEVGETGVASDTLTDIFRKKDAFQNPKPVCLIEELLSHANATTILDFFAGSGTTLHAVMKLNAEDGGKRTCILVTNNENGICEKVTYERNRRVIQGYVNAKGWDCPRAAVLLIFRDIKSVTFTMQTVGRILRMPEQRHYAEAALNRGYVYTNLARDRIEIVRDDIDYFREAPILARRKEGIDNVRLTSESASRPSQVGHNRLGSDFYGTLIDVAGEELLHRPVQLELDFSAFEEEEVENVAA